MTASSLREPTRARRLLRGSGIFVSLIAGASCGSRTGLFGPTPDSIIDASVDVDVSDAGADGADAPVDAPLDVIDEPVGCRPGTFVFTLATPQLMLVLDRSGSMDFALDRNEAAGVGEPSRWMTLHDALAQTITPFSSQIAMGARFYPAANADRFDPIQACIQDPQTVAIAPALNNVSTILDTFNQTSPVGGTPSAVALQLAAAQTSASRAVARAMVIATDGAPNCNGALDGEVCSCTSMIPDACRNGAQGSTNCLDDVRTITTIQDIYGTRKIPVYVIGIGVTSPFAPTLDAMAIAGGRPRSGTPKYFAANTPSEMLAAFTVVRDSVAKCSYVTPSSPDQPDSISVVVNGAPVSRDPSHVDGWDWIDREYGHLQLFGAACNESTATNVSGTISCNDDAGD